MDFLGYFEGVLGFSRGFFGVLKGFLAVFWVFLGFPILFDSFLGFRGSSEGFLRVFSLLTEFRVGVDSSRKGLIKVFDRSSRFLKLESWALPPKQAGVVSLKPPRPWICLRSQKN